MAKKSDEKNALYPDYKRNAYTKHVKISPHSC
jgi:hypothetical protein